MIDSMTKEERRNPDVIDIGSGGALPPAAAPSRTRSNSLSTNSTGARAHAADGQHEPVAADQDGHGLGKAGMFQPGATLPKAKIAPAIAKAQGTR